MVQGGQTALCRPNWDSSTIWPLFAKWWASQHLLLHSKIVVLKDFFIVERSSCCRQRLGKSNSFIPKLHLLIFANPTAVQNRGVNLFCEVLKVDSPGKKKIFVLILKTSSNVCSYVDNSHPPSSFGTLELLLFQNVLFDWLHLILALSCVPPAGWTLGKEEKNMTKRSLQ